MPDVDVAVIGAGPAGCLCAALLAEAGHSVCVFERDRFPRPRVGESLLPTCTPLLARIGIDLADGRYQPKAGAEFIDESTRECRVYPFADAMPGCPRIAHQVERSLFDRDLADAAARAGADVMFETAATGVEVDSASATVVAGSRRWRSRFVVDASGRATFLGRRHRSIEPVRELGRAAAYVHFEGVSADVYAELAVDGNVKVLRNGDGWTWAIPMCSHKLSVGTVVQQGQLAPDLPLRAVAASPLLRRLTHGARVAFSDRVGDFSYANTAASGPRWVCVGDASGFIDPVFSSGVALALESAATMADLLSPALSQSREDAPDLMRPLSEHMRSAYHVFFAMAHRFYNTAILDNLLLAQDPDPNLRRGLITLLAGDVWRDDNPFQTILLRSTRVNPPPGW